MPYTYCYTLYHSNQLEAGVTTMKHNNDIYATKKLL